ncbi:hypothetical protein IQ06DRAFT_365558, partial [Phaeosphaeriaceae sp. SRC1lsM3a]
ITSEPVTILVGEVKEEFFVHAQLLTTSSKYLEKLLEHKPNERMESTERTLRTVKLLDVDNSAFRLYSKWLYTGHFHFADVTASKVSSKPSPKLVWDELSSCYGLSVFLEAAGFADATIDALIDQMKILNDSPVNLAKWIFPHTANDSKHRTLCCDIVVHTWDRTKFNLLWKTTSLAIS